MKVQKIANYEQRIQEYHQECRDFWFKEFSLIAVIGAIVIFGLMFGLTKFGVSPDLDWRLLSFIFWTGLLIPPIKIMHPERPDPSDVLRDQALRRSISIDDSVSE